MTSYEISYQDGYSTTYGISHLFHELTLFYSEIICLNLNEHRASFQLCIRTIKCRIIYMNVFRHTYDDVIRKFNENSSYVPSSAILPPASA
jgi:hypothetical protein